MSGLLTYNANNSGGDWWLTDDDWHALEDAGWTVEWRDFLGSPASEASKRFNDQYEGVREFETVANQDATAEGCNCCGPPHSFGWEDDSGKTAYAYTRRVKTVLDWS